MRQIEIRKDYKNFKSSYKTILFRRQVQIIQYLILLIHLLCTVFFTLHNIQPQLKGSIDFLANFITNVKSHYLTYNVARIFSSLGIVLCLLLIALRFLRSQITPVYDQISLHKNLDKILVIIVLIISFILQSSTFLVFWAYSEVYVNEGLIIFLIQSFFPALGIMLYNYKYQSLSLFGWMTVPVALSLTLIENWSSYFIIICISAYLLVTQNSLVRKIFYGWIILLSVFILKNSFIFMEQDPAQLKIPFLCLGVMKLLVPFLIFKFQQKLTLKSEQVKIQEAFTLLSQMKGQIPFNQLKFKQFYELYNTVISFSMVNSQEKQCEIEKIVQFPAQQLTRGNFLFLLQKYLEKQCKKTAQQKNVFLKQLLLYKLHLVQNYPMKNMQDQLFSLYEEFQRSGKKYQQRFFILLDQTINKYALVKDGQLQTANIFYANKLHQSFQAKVNLLLDKLSLFWRQMFKQQLRKVTLDSSFEEILSLEYQIQNFFQIIEQFGSFQNERIIVNKLSLIFNTYQQENKTTMAQIKRGNQVNQNQNNHLFLILQNNLIKFVSKDLLKILGQNGNFNFQNSDKKVLFGEEFNHIVDNLIRNMSLKSQNDWVTIPILCKDGCIQLKKIKLMWYPSLETKNRTLIKFADDPELAQDAFMIYHCQTDTIRYFNSKLVKAFSIDQEKLQYQINNYQVFFNEIFIGTDVPAEEVKSHLKEDNSLRCKIYLKNYVEKGTPFSLPIEIKVFKSVVIDQEPVYCILKLSKLKEKKQAMGGPSTETTDNRTPGSASVNKFVSSNENMLAKKYANETFFCKIPNHYESKITEKQAQLEESGRWVHRYFIHLLFGLMFCTVLTFWVLDYKFLQDRIQQYQNEFISVQNTSQQYALLYQMYSLAMKRYYISKFPLEILKVKGAPASVYNKIYQTAEQSVLDQFLRRYLTQINRQPSNQIDYNINFQYFSIQTDNKQSTLMDFAQHVKRNIATAQIDFLLKNYDNFRNLTIQYENSFNYSQKISKIVNTYVLYFWILIAATIFSILTILYILWKIQGTIQIVYELIARVSIRQLNKTLSIFNEKKMQIENSFNSFSALSKPNIEQEKQKKQKSEASSISDINADQPKSYSEINSPNSINEQNSPRQDSIVQKSNQQNENEINQKLALLTENNQRTNLSHDNKQRIIDESLLLKIIRKLFFIAILIVLNMVFLFDYVGLTTQRDGIIEIFDVKRKLYISLLHVKRQEVDAPMKPIMEYYFNKTIDDIYHPTKIDLVSQIPDKLIFYNINEFAYTARKLVSSNMCSNIGTYAKAALKPCQTYLDGIVEKGFAQTFDIYQANAKKLSTQSIKQFGDFRCTSEKCPYYYEHEFVSLLMGQTVRYLILVLNDQINQTYNQLILDWRQQIVFKVIGLVLMLALYLWSDYGLKRRCTMAIKYFRIIPKKIMCSMKLTTYMRKNKILNKFDIL